MPQHPDWNPQAGPLATVSKRLSIVVPCYNEEDCLEELFRRLGDVAGEVAGDDYEIVLVNDGSQDGTWRLIKEAARSDPRVVGIDMSRNYGHQLALSAGLSYCAGERILVIDADLQDPPELLKEMMRLMDEGYDVVYGQRRRRDGETYFKRTSAAMFYRLLARVTDVDIPIDAGDFRLMSRRALDMLLSMPEQHRFIRGMVSWIGYRQIAIPYDRSERYAGVTKYPLKKMVRFAVDAITGFSIQPLRLASQLGLVLGACGVFLIIYILQAYFRGHVVQGWTSLMAVVVILGSIQMLVLGFLGEYVGRIYIESKRRPLFIVQEVARGDTVASAGENEAEGEATVSAFAKK